jgi:hypothetical protein
MDEGWRPKVADLLPDRLDGIERRVRDRLREDPGVGASRLAWGLIGSEVEGALKALLDCDLLELLGKAWTTARALQDYADPALHPPGEAAVVHLGERDIERELHPVIKVTIGDCPPMELRFTVTLAAHFSGLALSLRCPFVTGGSAGEVHASASLSYGEVELVKAKDSKKLALPGRFRFAPPLEIPRRDRLSESPPAPPPSSPAPAAP